MSLNKWIGTGVIGRMNELKYTNGGAAVLDISLAVKDRVRRHGEYVDETVWVSVQVWGKVAEAAANNLDKGSVIGIEGRLKCDQWTDKTSGAKREKLFVVCDKLDYIQTKKSQRRDETQQREQSHNYQSPVPPADQRTQQPQPAFSDDGFGGDDDIPF